MGIATSSLTNIVSNTNNTGNKSPSFYRTDPRISSIPDTSSILFDITKNSNIGGPFGAGDGSISLSTNVPSAASGIIFQIAYNLSDTKIGYSKLRYEMTGDKWSDWMDNTPGAQGPAGPKGDAGVKGDTGAAGPAGVKGDLGLAGPAGPKGDTGSKGDIGAAGAKGDLGPAGPAGPKGDTGSKGDLGPVGAKGDTGPAGAVGPLGPVGPVGAKGDIGPVGPIGPTGSLSLTGNTSSFGLANNNTKVTLGTTSYFIDNTGAMLMKSLCLANSGAGGTCLEEIDLKKIKSLWIKDTRKQNVNDTPQKYRDAFAGQSPLTINEFKENIAINTPFSGGYAFCTLQTVIPWGDPSGGAVLQYVFTNGSADVMKKRYELTPTTWSSWIDIHLTGDNKLCIGSTCVTENDFKRLLDKNEATLISVPPSYLPLRPLDPSGIYRIEIFDKNDGTFINTILNVSTKTLNTLSGNNIDLRVNNNQLEVQSKNGNAYLGKQYAITRIS